MVKKERKTCFVVGPIGKTGTETHKNADFLLKGIIRPAIESELDIRIWRADEDNRPGMITDKVIIDIHDLDLVIADLSELNPNAFYELGIRHAAAKPTIHMASAGTVLPFDNLGHRAIFFDKTDWDSIELAKKQLLEQAKLALDTDFTPSNPITQALSAKAFNASANPSDKMVAELLSRVERIESDNIGKIRKRDVTRTPSLKFIFQIYFNKAASLYDGIEGNNYEINFEFWKEKYGLDFLNELIETRSEEQILEFIKTEYVIF